MRDLETVITQKGQVTIPVAVRRRLDLKPNDRVEFVVEGDRAFVRRAASRILAGYGAVTPLQRPEDFGEIRRQFEEGVSDDVIAETPSDPPPTA